MKKKLLFAAAMVASAFGFNAQAQSVGDVITVDDVKFKVIGENIITNGSFDDGVSGWKTVGYTTDAVASDFTITETGGFDDGAYITTNGGGAGSAKTIRQSVAVKSGSSYYFSVYTSGKAPSSNNFAYNALFKMKDATTEDGVLKQFAWPQGANQTATDWSKTEYVFTADEAHPYVGVRMRLNQNSKFDGFVLGEVECDKTTLWEAALAAAKTAQSDEAYSNVDGSERAALDAVISNYEEDPGTNYQAIAEEINAATDAFKAAKEAYDLAASTPELPYADPDKAPYIDEGTTAANLLIAIREYYESNAAAENVDGAVDMRDHILNNDATDGNNSWTWTGNKNNPRNTESWTDSEGNHAYMYFDGGNWSGTGWTTTMEQAITLPAGRYLLTAKGRASDGVTLTMSVGEESVALPNVNASGNVFDRGWNDGYVVFETDGNAVTIMIKATTEGNHQWFSVGDFRLMQLEAIEVPMATAEDYAALAAAFSAADAKTLGFDAGEYAPYNNVEALQALAAAKAIDPENADGNTKEVVTNATSALTAATWTANTEEVNAIYNGDFAASTPNTTSGENVDMPGWTLVQGNRLVVKDLETDPGLAYTDGQAAVFSWGGTTSTYGEQTGYTLPLKANQVYELSFKISGWRDGDFANVVTATLDGVSYSLNPSQFVQAINVSEGNPFKEVKFYLTPEADNSVLNIYANHHHAITDLKLMKVAGNLAINEAQSYDIMQAGKIDVELTRTIKEGVNSVVLPFELTADDIAELGGTGAVAYTVSGYDAEKENLKLAEATSVAANTPFFLKATAASTSSFVFDEKTLIAGEPTKTVGDATLVGTYAKIEAVPTGSYILSGGKFYLVNSTVSLKSTRAYVTVPAGAGAKSVLNVEVEDATAIVGVESEVANSEIYDITGRKVSAPARGLYIANGKKVLVK